MHHVVLNFLDGRIQRFLTGHEQIGRVQGHAVGLIAELLAAYRVNLVHRLNLIAKEVDAESVVGVGRKHVYRVALHPKRAARELYFGARV